MLNKKINKFSADIGSSENPNNKNSKHKEEKPQVYNDGDSKSKTKIITKWVLTIVCLGLLIFLFWYACAPKSNPISVKNVTVKDESGKKYAVLTTNGGTPVEIDITNPNANGWSTYYLNTGASIVYTGYATSVSNGTVSFRIEKWTTFDSTSKPVFTYQIGSFSSESTLDPSLEAWLNYTTTDAASVQSNNNTWSYILINLLPTLILVGLMVWMYSRMAKLQGGAIGGEDSIFGMGKSQAKIAHSNVKFSDVAGIEEEKAELIEIVDYLKNPDKYAAMGARTPRGVILYGPPGTGKTLLAKAVAGEAKVPFFQVSGSAFEDMLVGVGAKRVRDLFNKAKKAAPAIIFIDELDSVASKRGKYDVSGSSGLADQTINQLLAEMDGFSTRTGVVVMAATNRLDVIDDAILRPGRFDRHIQVNLPDIKEREAILKIHARNKNLSSRVDLAEIARRTPGFSGAQLENVLNEATLLAVRLNKSSVGMSEIDEAIDRVIAGPAKHSRVITEAEKKQIAYHEAGHALVGLHQPGSDVVEKITIIPRGQAAGYTLATPEKQEIQIQKKTDLLAIITSTLAGRAAEEVIYGKDSISTGAANDLYKVTNIVRSMVTQLGMTELGMTQFIPSEGVMNPNSIKLYSDDTAKKIDAQIEKIIKTQYEKAKEIISKNKKELDLIVTSLLLLETIVKSQIDYIHKNLKLPEEALKIQKELEASKDKTESK